MWFHDQVAQKILNGQTTPAKKIFMYYLKVKSKFSNLFIARTTTGKIIGKMNPKNLKKF
jgi:hypothetical protein